MGSQRLLTALLAVAAVILVAYYAARRRGHRTYTATGRDGTTVGIACAPGKAVNVVQAHYYPPGPAGAPVVVDVTAALRAALDGTGGPRLPVCAAAFGQAPGGTLTFQYRCHGRATRRSDFRHCGPPAAQKSGFRPLPVSTSCARVVQEPREGFRPVPVSTCAPYDDYYGVDMTGLRASPRDAAGTVAWDPYSTQSRVSLERYAESPEVAEAPNPVTGLGRTSAVRAMGDRYRRNEALTRLSAYDLSPGEPGYMEEVGDAHAMSLMAVVARRSPQVAGGAPACLLAGADIDSDYFSDGFYDESVLMESFSGGHKEGLTSTRGPMPNTLTASRVGLGSIRMDPRFEPGPESRTPDGDASWSPGGWAGGPTTGAYAPSVFAPPNNWDWQTVHGFGDGSMWGRTYPVEAIVTERSEW